jgi:hypothetical protein
MICLMRVKPDHACSACADLTTLQLEFLMWARCIYNMAHSRNAATRDIAFQLWPTLMEAGD